MAMGVVIDAPNATGAKALSRATRGCHKLAGVAEIHVAEGSQRTRDYFLNDRLITLSWVFVAPWHHTTPN
jgi:hypothetical protein